MSKVIVPVKMAQGAAVPFVYPFAIAALYGGGSQAAMQTAGYEVSRRLGIELTGTAPAFVLGNVFQQNTPNVPGQGGGLLTTLAQEGMNVGVEKLDKALGHRAALARGNVFAIADELAPVLIAGVDTGWKSDPFSLLSDWSFYNAARTGYDPQTHSWLGPNQLASFLGRYGIKAGLFLARRFTTGTGIGRFLNIRHWFKGAS